MRNKLNTGRRCYRGYMSGRCVDCDGRKLTKNQISLDFATSWEMRLRLSLLSSTFCDTSRYLVAAPTL